MRLKFALTLLFILMTGFLAAQTDIGPNTITTSNRLHGITASELAYEQNKVSINVPYELYVQLEQARQKEDFTEAERIQGEIEKYTPGIFKTQNNQSNGMTAVGPPSVPPFSPDWVSNDILIRAGKVGGYYSTDGNRRTIDLKYGKDGRLYLALCTDSTAGVTHYIYFYRSTNSGLTWTGVGGLQGAGTFSSVSMSVDRKGSVNDSIRISCYYTYGTGGDATDAGLYLFSFRPRLWNDDYRFHTLATPLTGRKYCYVSAVSDGWYYDASAYIGCVAGEYSNNGDSTKTMHLFRTTNWGLAHTGATLNGVYTGYQGDFYPSACFKRSQNVYSDSVYIAVERRFGTSDVDIRIFAATWTPSAPTEINYLTSATGVYRRPSLTVRQTQYSRPRQILVSYVKNGECLYSFSTNDGTTWSVDASLDPHSSDNGFFTCVTSDTLTTNACFAAVFTTSSDSVNVRRGFPGNMSNGELAYKINSVYSSGTTQPVIAIYRSNVLQMADVSYAGSGPTDCWFDAENLPTGIRNPIGSADKYDLEQNFPNPFNPKTSITFSIPKDEFVTLVVYDITGREAAKPVNERLNAGKYIIEFNAQKFSSGVYFYRINAGNFTSVRKMMLVK